MGTKTNCENRPAKINTECKPYPNPGYFEVKVYKQYEALRKDNGEKIKGSLLYDSDQDCWRIVTQFFDIEQPKLDDQFGVYAHEIQILTLTPVLI